MFKMIEMCKIKKLIAFFMVCSIVFLFPACAADNTGPSAQDTESAESAASDPFENVDFAGRSYRILTSIDDMNATNANALIEGSGALNGELVNDAVWGRNNYVEEFLNIDLVFTQQKSDYGTCTTDIRKIVMTGEDTYDLIINDVRSFMELTLEGMFVNIYDDKNIDFSKAYWNYDYMDELSFIKGYMTVLAGDYFMDTIGSAHCLLLNTKLLENLYGDPMLFYNLALDGQWTIENAQKYINGAYADLNGNDKSDLDDQYGLGIPNTWGYFSPLVISAGAEIFSRNSEGYYELTVNNPRTVTLIEKLGAFAFDDGVNFTYVCDSAASSKLNSSFSAGLVLLASGQRLCNLSNYRDLDFVGAITYPKLDEEQNSYITSTHDTTEVGVIPVTVRDIDFVTTVLEVLNRETTDRVTYVYYEEALKIKYSSDETMASMIDMMHDNIKGAFIMGYDTSFKYNPVAFLMTDLIMKNSTDFASAYAKYEEAMLIDLDRMAGLTEALLKG
ncbi:MAG: hypothetical protein PHZ09_00420 [Eubacteriales bacterium]|nr:hypothetical protein [Eubacteriales bacterium]